MMETERRHTEEMIATLSNEYHVIVIRVTERFKRSQRLDRRDDRVGSISSPEELH